MRPFLVLLFEIFRLFDPDSDMDIEVPVGGYLFIAAGVGYLFDSMGLLLISSYTTTPGPIAAVIATGIPAATQSAVLAFRNKKSRQTTKPSPIRPLSMRISRRAEIAAARVRISSTVTPSGNVA